MNLKKSHEIWISDLTHTEQGIVSRTFPLGASCVYSYAKKNLGKDFNFKLFKFPSKLNEELIKKSPKVLGFSNYKWNFELSYKFAVLAKQRDPELITVWGGPNFPIDLNEKIDFLKKWPAIDFSIELEGELGFVDLIEKLSKYNFKASDLKKNREKIINTCYLHENELVSGPINRIKDVNIVPSPYLNGTLDEFFDQPLIPLFETTRGCPFACAFCADGQASKNKIHRYHPERTKEELNYIAKRIKNMSELMNADLNFGMYKQDVVTANIIRDIQEKYDYPQTVIVATGKNMPQRVIDVASIIKGWQLGASIQSTDESVLKASNRQNITSSAYKKLIDFGNKSNNTKTYTDLMVALPGDTKEKHFNSLRWSIDSNVRSIRMHQSIMLVGTDMASKNTRNNHGLKTKFRTVPGAVGYYEILEKKYPIAEIEEIIIGSNTLSEKDYIECRIMDLFIQTFYNNYLFEEVFALLKSLNVSAFDCMLYINDHPELYSNNVKEIIKDFVSGTIDDLYDTLEEAQQSVLSPDIMVKYIEGKLGYNELLENTVRLFNKFEDSRDLMFKSVKGTLQEKNLFSKDIEKYLNELEKFISIRKNEPLRDIGSIKSMSFSYDFEAIRENDYIINPKSMPLLEEPLRFDFFHDQEQQKYISNQVKMYSAQAEGMGRLLFQSDSRLIFRSFSKSS
tara:strand:+ start:11295 stop:13334 length:2040 start_codon:yes stop_codon:yes gene_type:complete